MKNPYKKEFMDLTARLARAGFKCTGAYDTEEMIKTTDWEVAVDHISACDEGWLYVQHPDDECEVGLYIILGNNPGDLVNDYSLSLNNDEDRLESIVMAHSGHWE